MGTTILVEGSEIQIDGLSKDGFGIICCEWGRKPHFIFTDGETVVELGRGIWKRTAEGFVKMPDADEEEE